MAERNEQVLDRVRQELNRKRDVGSRQLWEIGKQMDASLGDLSLPQFHARYVLPVLREHARQRREAEGEAEVEKPAKQPRKRATRQTGRPAGGRRPRQASEPDAPAPQRAARRGGAAAREHVRTVFLEFAREFAEAESRTQLVQVLSKVDDYVDRVVGGSR